MVHKYYLQVTNYKLIVQHAHNAVIKIFELRIKIRRSLTVLKLNEAQLGWYPMYCYALITSKISRS